MAERQESLPQASNTLLEYECPNCGEELIKLHCDHWVCSSCLADLFMLGKDEQGNDEVIKCAVCDTPLSRQPAEYTTSRVYSLVRNYANDMKVAEKEGKDDGCNHRNCFQKASLLCTHCRKFICTGCQGRPCLTFDDQHEVKAIADCANEIQEKFALWLKGKRNTINELKAKRGMTQANDRSYNYESSKPGQSISQTADASHSSVRTPEGMQRLDEEIAEEESALRFAEMKASKVKGIPLLRLLNALIVYEEQRQVELGSCELLIEEVQYFDVCETSSGHLLLARDGGVQIYDPQGQHQLHFLTYRRYVFAIESYRDMAILGVRISDTKKMMVTLDASYKEIRRWEIPEETQDFTVVNDTIFLSLAIDDKGLTAYGLHTGERKQQADMEWKGEMAGVTHIAPSSIVFDDRAKHMVYKQCLAMGDYRTEWTTRVPAPHCLCVDDNGLIWVRSNRNDSLTILDRDGGLHQDPIIDDKITELGTINGICVHRGWLYLAYEDGLARFPISYVQS